MISWKSCLGLDKKRSNIFKALKLSDLDNPKCMEWLGGGRVNLSRFKISLSKCCDFFSPVRRLSVTKT